MSGEKRKAEIEAAAGQIFIKLKLEKISAGKFPPPSNETAREFLAKLEREIK